MSQVRSVSGSGLVLLIEKWISGPDWWALSDRVALYITVAMVKSLILFRASGPPCFLVNYAARRFASLFAALRCEFRERVRKC